LSGLGDSVPQVAGNMMAGRIDGLDVVQWQDLLLLQQARGLDLGQRESRRKSCERLQAFFLELQGILRPPLSLEIGAHKAQYSRWMCRLGGEVHAFEANPHNHAAFAPRIRTRSPAVNYHHMAMSDIDGTVTFQVKVSRDGKKISKVSGSNSLRLVSHPSVEYERVEVPSTRLDTFLRERGLEGREFSAWIDVEGALDKVTAGFGDALGSCLSLIVEVEEVPFWQGQMLRHDAMRYFFGEGLVPVARDFERPHQYNIVYLRRDMLANPKIWLNLEHFYSGREIVPNQETDPGRADVVPE